MWALPESSTPTSSPKAPRAKWLRRTALIIAVLGVLFVGLMSVAHTSFGRPILMWLSGVGVTGGCPLGLDQSDPAATEVFRQEQLAKREGKVAARSTKALDFELGETTRVDVDAWVLARQAICESERQGSVLKCSSYAATADAEPTTNDLFMQFDASSRLVAVDLMRPPTTPDVAAATFTDSAEVVVARVGPPTATRGEADASWLGAEPMRQASREFRYQGYVAMVTATNHGPRGVRVREQYQWAGDDE